MLPEIERISNSFTRVDVNGITVWFSYDTPIAFRMETQGVVATFVRENDWSNTTGKHLNSIDGGDKDAKDERLTEEEFNFVWSNLVEKVNNEECASVLL